ncbi:hypothetical protein [Gallibacterium anatis]|uniref:DUF7210 domain-containing protein n=1 Tax=Gallibacterium anatis TaxID=750 RepID=A0A1A7P7N6_9PAST|nr:hypothetical protein [Gallibacterium anatis]OBW98053.1 hypothetical protein QV03_07900 [Gallibacterium anatis]
MANPSTKTLLTCIVAHTAILHNGKRYDVGEEINLSEAQYKRLSHYLTVKDDSAAQKAKAQAKAQALAEQAKAEVETSANAKADAEATAKTKTAKEAK